jgi:hypothetical protein
MANPAMCIYIYTHTHSRHSRYKFVLCWLIVGYLGVLAKYPRGTTGAYIRGTIWAEYHPGVG